MLWESENADFIHFITYRTRWEKLAVENLGRTAKFFTFIFIELNLILMSIMLCNNLHTYHACLMVLGGMGLCGLSILVQES